MSALPGQPSPDRAYSHSIVNEPFFRLNFNGLIIGVCGNTMKNTMLRNSCVVITQDHGQVAVGVKINLSPFFLFSIYAPSLQLNRLERF